MPRLSKRGEEHFGPPCSSEESDDSLISIGGNESSSSSSDFHPSRQQPNLGALGRNSPRKRRATGRSSESREKHCFTSSLIHGVGTRARRPSTSSTSPIQKPLPDLLHGGPKATPSPLTTTTKQPAPPSRVGEVELRIIRQPEEQHRARYMSEGSRGAIKDRSGRSHVTIQLTGIEAQTELEVWIGTGAGTLAPHPLYQVIPVTGKGGLSNTPCKVAKNSNGVECVYVTLQPEEDMIAVLDCLGILKLCSYNKRGISKDKSGRHCSVRLVFGVKLRNGTALQTVSTPIDCVQQLGQPEVQKVSSSKCTVRGGKELYIVGRNFAKGSSVVFRESNDDGKIVWSADAEVLTDYLHQTHIICRVPTYRDLQIRGTGVPVSVIVQCGKKHSRPFPFTFTPDKLLLIHSNKRECPVQVVPQSTPPVTKTTGPYLANSTSISPGSLPPVWSHPPAPNHIAVAPSTNLSQSLAPVEPQSHDMWTPSQQPANPQGDERDTATSQWTAQLPVDAHPTAATPWHTPTEVRSHFSSPTTTYIASQTTLQPKPCFGSLDTPASTPMSVNGSFAAELTHLRSTDVAGFNTAVQPESSQTGSEGVSAFTYSQHSIHDYPHSTSITSGAMRQNSSEPEGYQNATATAAEIFADYCQPTAVTTQPASYDTILEQIHVFESNLTPPNGTQEVASPPQSGMAPHGIAAHGDDSYGEPSAKMMLLSTDFTTADSGRVSDNVNVQLGFAPAHALPDASTILPSEPLKRADSATTASGAPLLSLCQQQCDIGSMTPPMTTFKGQNVASLQTMLDGSNAGN